VHLIGQGPEADALVRLGRDLAVELVLERAWQDDQAVAAAYRSATVVVAPSRFEGFGLTPVEGVATGIPTVASDIPPHREHLGDAATYFRLEDDDSLVAAIHRALERGPADPGAVRDLGIPAAARRFAEGLGARLGGPSPG
jgi:glycosyltransferase involved in cell wall biosynthesis